MYPEAYLLARSGRGVVPVLLTTMWVALGCGGSTNDPDLPDVGAGTDNDVFPDTQAESIVFVPSSALTMVAGQPAELVVQVQPPGVHTVRFALLGKTDNAFLSQGVVETSADGVAKTTLNALSAASSFTVRAASSRVSGTLDVVTLEASQASLVIKPNYEGRRPVESWVASVHLNTTCSSLQGIPFPDGQLDSDGAETVRIAGIPAEVPMAVVVRAGQFAGGCRGVPSLRANSEADVEIGRASCRERV